MIDTAPLFAPLHAELLGLLRSLTPDDWLRPTVAGSWRVRDVAAHLLDGDLRKVAAYRDDHLAPSDAPIGSPADLARLVNGLNASGVHYAAAAEPAPADRSARRDRSLGQRPGDDIAATRSGALSRELGGRVRLGQLDGHRP
jgi:hypothetical protein